MKITYSITKEDFWNYNKHVYYSTREGKKQIVLLFICAPISLFTFNIYSTNSKLLSLLSAISVIMFSYYVGFYRFKKKIFKFAKNEKGILDEQTVDIDSNGISRITHSHDIFSKWSAVTKIEMIDQYIFIFFNKSTEIIIPKRIFKTENEAIQFYNMSNDFFNIK